MVGGGVADLVGNGAVAGEDQVGRGVDTPVDHSALELHVWQTSRGRKRDNH